MSQEKYIGMDVHQATISVAVMDGATRRNIKQDRKGFLHSSFLFLLQ